MNAFDWRWFIKLTPASPCRAHKVQLVRWLLNHGAHKSLHLKDRMGCTPLDVARIFGPHAEIEGELGAVILDRSFAQRFAITHGRNLLSYASPGDSSLNRKGLSRADSGSYSRLADRQREPEESKTTEHPISELSAPVSEVPVLPRMNDAAEDDVFGIGEDRDVAIFADQKQLDTLLESPPGVEKDSIHTRMADKQNVVNSQRTTRFSASQDSTTLEVFSVAGGARASEAAKKLTVERKGQLTSAIGEGLPESTRDNYAQPSIVRRTNRAPDLSFAQGNDEATLVASSLVVDPENARNSEIANVLKYVDEVQQSRLDHMIGRQQEFMHSMDDRLQARLDTVTARIESVDGQYSAMTDRLASIEQMLQTLVQERARMDV